MLESVLDNNLHSRKRSAGRDFSRMAVLANSSICEKASREGDLERGEKQRQE